ncbi:MAG: hypothetical protein E7638_05030 [Ruminococcaceae bacterium]|nr:hypothetical protein [Oscillospiraceae bacterium]
MKKCKKCGALQNDDRTVCIDCGTLLGRPMTAEEEAAEEASIDSKLDDMAERTEDFYVPIRDKVMGILCILGIIAAFVLINLTGTAKDAIKDSIPDNVMVSTGNGAVVIMSDGVGNYEYPSRRMGELNDAALFGLLGIITHLAACPMLLVPRFMWFLDTLKYRIFYEWDTTPSDFALFVRKAVTYMMFAVGIICIMYGYSLYF